MLAISTCAYSLHIFNESSVGGHVLPHVSSPKLLSGFTSNFILIMYPKISCEVNLDSVILPPPANMLLQWYKTLDLYPVGTRGYKLD